MNKIFQFLDALRKNWGTIVTSGALIGAIGIWQGLGHLVSHGVYWAVGLIGLALAFFRVWESESAKYEAAEGRLEQEKSLHGGPEISFVWGALPPLNTRKTLFLENSGPSDAYEVKVSNIGLNKTVCAAEFPTIPKCPKGSKEALKFELVGNSVPHSHKDEIEMIVYASGADLSKDDKGNDVVDFPIAVAYQEYGGARYEADFRFLADTHLQEVNIHRVTRRRVH